MKKTVQLFCLLLALIFMDACDSEKEITPPNTVLSADSMVMVMADVHLAEARLLNAGYHADQPGLKSDILQATLLTDGVDTARFNASFKWYSQHPSIFSNVYDEVLNELSRRQAKLKEKKVDSK